MKKNGFTIVELLIYMGLVTMLTIILTRIFTSIIDVQLSGEATSAVEQDSRYLYSRLSYDINRAGTIVEPATIGAQTNTLIITIGSVANTYSISGTHFLLTNDQGTNQLNSYGTQISNLSFQRLGNINGKNSIKVTFTITSTIQKASGAETKNVEITSALR